MKTHVSKEVFLENFGNCVCVGPDEFMYSGADKWEVLSYNSIAIEDCITMFGIGNNRSLFAWHSSTVPEGLHKTRIDEEIVLDELEKLFKYQEDIRNTQFEIYLVGGNGSEPSAGLYDGMVSAIPKFFKNAIIVADFMNPTENTGKKFITVNFNTNGELHYYFHNRQPYQDFWSSSGGGV